MKDTSAEENQHSTQLDSTSLKEWISAQKQKAVAHRKAERYDSAHWVFDTTIHVTQPLARENAALKELGWLYAGKAYIQAELEGDFIGAKSNYLKAAGCFEENGLADEQVGRFIYSPLGNIYTRLGDPEQAIGYLKKFHQLAHQAGQNSAVSDACNDIGLAFLELDDLEQSAHWFQLGLADSVISPLNKGVLHCNLAKVFMRQEDWYAASKSAVRVLELLEPGQDKLQWVTEYRADARSTALNILLKVRARQGDLKEFTALKDQALDEVEAYFKNQNHRSIAKVYLAIAQGHFFLEAYSEAVQSFDQAIQVLIPNARIGENNLAADQLYPETLLADAFIGKANSLESMLESGPEKTETLVEELVVHYDRLFELEPKIRGQILSTSSRTAHSTDFAEIGEQAVLFSHKMYQQSLDEQWIWKALSYAEAAKGILLSESVNRNILETGSRATQDVVWKLRQLEQEIASELIKHEPSAEIIHDLRQEESKLKNELEATNEGLFSQLYQTNYHSVDTLKAWVQSQDSLAILSGFDTEDYTYLFAYSSASIACVQILRDSLFIHELQAFMTSCESHVHLKPQEYELIGFPVYQRLFLNELQPLLSEKNSWVFIPDGVLSYISLDALPTKTVHPTSYRDMAFLLKSKSIRYAPSFSFLFHSDKDTRLPSSGDALVLQPDFSCDSTLVTISDEDLFDIERAPVVRTLKGQEANIEQLRQEVSEAQIIHFATHGFASRRGDQHAWIALADTLDPCSHKKMFFPEMQTSSFNADLAVLEVCQSGSGQIQPGEGVLSISHGLVHAGCRNVISSSWNANSHSTRQVLGSFYRHWFKSGQLVRSLRKAKLEYLLDETTDELAMHPYYWSGMVLVGSGHTQVVPVDKGRPLWWLWVLIVILLSGFLGYVRLRS